MKNRFAETIRIVLEAAARRGSQVALIGGFALPFHGIRRFTEDVDFLLDHAAADDVHTALLRRGERCLHRSEDAANYETTSDALASVDLLYARRPATLEMLDRAVERPLTTSGLAVRVVDAAGIIGLKVQAIANDPARLDRDRDDIRELLVTNLESLDLGLVRGYFRTFEMEDLLDRLLEDIRRRA
jgi:hypothetical protein